MTTEFIIGILLGGITTLIFREVESSLRHREENKLLKSENKLLRNEKEERQNRTLRNENNIVQIKEKQAELEEQVILCLELVSKVTEIKNDLDATTQVAATRLLRVHLKLPPNDDTYISD